MILEGLLIGSVVKVLLNMISFVLFYLIFFSIKVGFRLTFYSCFLIYLIFFFLISKNVVLSNILTLRAYMMEIIPETPRAQ